MSLRDRDLVDHPLFASRSDHRTYLRNTRCASKNSSTRRPSYFIADSAIFTRARFGRHRARGARVLRIASVSRLNTMHTILRLPAVMANIGLYPQQHLPPHRQKGTFPKPVSLGTRAVGWLQSDIEEWLGQKVRKLSREAL